jgi:hypothetical protein
VAASSLTAVIPIRKPTPETITQEELREYVWLKREEAEARVTRMLVREGIIRRLKAGAEFESGLLIPWLSSFRRNGKKIERLTVVC